MDSFGSLICGEGDFEFMGYRMNLIRSSCQSAVRQLSFIIIGYHNVSEAIKCIVIVWVAV